MTEETPEETLQRLQEEASALSEQAAQAQKNLEETKKRLDEQRALEEQRAIEEQQKQWEQFKEATKQAQKELLVEQQATQAEAQTPENQPTTQLEDAMRRMPAPARTTTELMQSIIEPTSDPEDRYDKYHALKDWDLTYTKNPEQRQYLMLGGKLVTALEHNGMFESASAINAECKRFAALLRSQEFAQQRELRSIRQFMEGKEEKKSSGGGFFNKIRPGGGQNE